MFLNYKEKKIDVWKLKIKALAMAFTELQQNHGLI